MGSFRLSCRTFLVTCLLFTLCLLLERLLYPSSPYSLAVVPPQHEGVPHITISATDVDNHWLRTPERSHNHLPVPQQHFHTYDSTTAQQTTARSIAHLQALLKCPLRPNAHSNHIRLPHIIQNISHVPPGDDRKETRQMFNPTILALPSWSKNQYLLVSRVVTEGFHQESLVCEANTCYAGDDGIRRLDEVDCTQYDLNILGSSGGLRCAEEPHLISIPPTPAEQCDGKWRPFADIPGFHDPRIFWSGRGEPLIIVNSHSQYACVGLWLQDLRSLHSSLQPLLQTANQVFGPLQSYPTITELTRAPASTRHHIEKNWFLFFPTKQTAYVHYDIAESSGRTFAKLIGNGFTTPNLTDPSENPCLTNAPDAMGRLGEWHQASNSLKVLLCQRADGEAGRCHEDEDGRSVHVALIHRKFSNEIDLPMRYERHFMVWSSKPPFHMLAMSKHPLLLANETASGWTEDENWLEDEKDESVVAMEGAGTSSAKYGIKKRFPAMVPEGISTNRPQNGSGLAVPLPHHSSHSQGDWNTSGNGRSGGKRHGRSPSKFAYFSYTPSINWARRSRLQVQQSGQEDLDVELASMQTGYLDDEIILGIGLDDVAQAFSRVKAESLLTCLKLCPVANGKQAEGGSS